MNTAPRLELALPKRTEVIHNPRMRAIGFMQGMRGDLVISTVAARAFKAAHPNYTLTLGLNKQYADMVALFANHESFDDIHLYDSYEKWPGAIDAEYHERSRFDIIYDPMPQRQNEATWWATEHQAQNACSMYNLKAAGLQCALTPWFDVPDNKTFIGLQPFGGWQDWPNKKSFSLARANEVVASIKALGFNVLQFGGAEEPSLDGAVKFTGSYFDSMRHMLGCKALVTTDSGRCWAASAYSFPTLGVYSSQYYTPQFVSNIQPVNPNARYLDADLVVNLPIDQIIATLKETIA